MIDWSQVKPGETVLVSNIGNHHLVLMVHGEYVWTETVSISQKPCQTYTKAFIQGQWTIYDPWREITSECSSWKSYGHWAICHEPGHIIDIHDPNYRVEGLRVWIKEE